MNHFKLSMISGLISKEEAAERVEEALEKFNLDHSDDSFEKLARRCFLLFVKNQHNKIKNEGKLDDAQASFEVYKIMTNNSKAKSFYDRLMNNKN